MSGGFLAEIVREVRDEIRRDDYLTALPPPSFEPRPSLRSAVESARGVGGLLVEFKRVSPGQTAPNLPVRTIEEFVRTTDGPAVLGYSCLATRPRFDGAPADVAELVRRTPKPVLFKDFVVDPVQLDAAVTAGASAVLLIARLETAGLLEQPLAQLVLEAHQRGLEVLLELHDPTEIPRAAELPVDLYGVNARDLDTLSIDRPAAEAAVEAAWGRGLAPLVGLSGVERPDDARRFFDSGADAVLVGTAVARADDPAAFLRSLVERPAERAR